MDLILSMSDSENLKTFSLSCGGLGFASPLDFEASGSGGAVRSSFTRVLRDLVRSRKGGTEMEAAPPQTSAHEPMKCHVEVPSRIAWLNAHPIASPSFSLVNCGHDGKKIQPVIINNLSKKKKIYLVHQHH